MSFSDFSSWPREQEASFVVYEQRAKEAQSKAWTIGGIAGAIVLLGAFVIAFAITPEKPAHSEDNTSTKSAPAAEKK
jgi:Na+/proline symporter